MLSPNFNLSIITRLGGFLMGRLRIWTKPIIATPLGVAVGDVSRSRWELMLENALLRQQLLVSNRQVKRPKLRGWDRAVIVGLAVCVQPGRRQRS